jgi:hypothetical protein
MLSEVFYSLLVSSGTGILVLLIKSCVKANANVDNMEFCFGLFKAHRVIRLEDIQTPSNGSDDERSGDGISTSLRLTPTNKPPDVKI